VRHIREGWASAFEDCPKSSLLMGKDIINQFDQDEWEW